MKSCQHFNDPAACEQHLQVIRDHQRKSGLPVKSMCASCRRAQPEKDRIESESLLKLYRKAGLC